MDRMKLVENENESDENRISVHDKIINENEIKVNLRENRFDRIPTIVRSNPKCMIRKPKNGGNTVNKNIKNKRHVCCFAEDKRRRRKLSKDGDIVDEETFMWLVFKIFIVVSTVLYGSYCIVHYFFHDNIQYNQYSSNSIWDLSATTSSSTRNTLPLKSKQQIISSRNGIGSIKSNKNIPTQWKYNFSSLSYFVSNIANESDKFETETPSSQFSNELQELYHNFIATYTLTKTTSNSTIYSSQQIMDVSKLLQNGLSTYPSSSNTNANDEVVQLSSLGLVQHFRGFIQQQNESLSPHGKNINRLFNVWVIGTSSAAGYGNYYNQSYGNILQGMMGPAFRVLNIQFQVTVLSFDDIEEFPMTWCIFQNSNNNNKQRPDVIVWDFGGSRLPAAFDVMDEHNAVTRLEAFLRTTALFFNRADPESNVTPVSNRRPFYIFRGLPNTLKPQPYRSKTVSQKFKEPPIPDSATLCLQLLQYYANQKIISDPLVLFEDEAAKLQIEYHNFPNGQLVTESAATILPKGFEKWNVYQTSFAHPVKHLSWQRHKFIAYLISIHILESLHLAIIAEHYMSRNADTSERSRDVSDLLMSLSSSSEQSADGRLQLPSPFSLELLHLEESLRRQNEQLSHNYGRNDSLTTTSWKSLLVMTNDLTIQLDRMDTTLLCSSSYELVPTANSVIKNMVDVQQSALPLRSLILNGTSKMQRNDDNVDTQQREKSMLRPKNTNMWYQSGWVLDLDYESKQNKVRTKDNEDNKYLGFQDWKQAYYGVAGSGPLQLFIPIRKTSSSEMTNNDADIQDPALAKPISILIACGTGIPPDIPPRRKPEDDPVHKCNLGNDVQFSVNGQVADIESIDSTIVRRRRRHHSSRMQESFLDRDVLEVINNNTLFHPSPCVQIQMSANVSLANRELLLSNKTNNGSNTEDGILLELLVTNSNVTWKNGPCSLSHLIWLFTSKHISD